MVVIVLSVVDGLDHLHGQTNVIYHNPYQRSGCFLVALERGLGERLQQTRLQPQVLGGGGGAGAPGVGVAGPPAVLHLPAAATVTRRGEAMLAIFPRSPH